MNYPDDIRSYDDDPRSPFYKEWRCPECGACEGETECTGDFCETDQVSITEYDGE